jgi:integrase/recombinase XerD
MAPDNAFRTVVQRCSMPSRKLRRERRTLEQRAQDNKKQRESWARRYANRSPEEIRRDRERNRATYCNRATYRARQAKLAEAKSEMSMTPAIDMFLDYLTIERGLAKNTLDNYGGDLRRFEALLPHGIERANADELREVFLQLLAGGLTPRSLARKLSTLRHYYSLLRRKGLISKVPLGRIPVPKIGMRLPKPVSTPDFEKLLRVADTGTPKGLRDVALLRVLDSCGLRVGELVTLEPDDLHLDEGYLIVRAGKGDKDRFVPIDQAGIRALRDYVERARPLLYSDERGWRGRRTDRPDTHIFPLTRQRFWQILRELCDLAGISGKHPHQLRHRFGSELTRSGLELRDVADLMGHSSVDTTLQYVGLDLDYIRGIFRATHPRVVEK